MNVIKFIQQHGIDKAREVVELAPQGATHLSNDTRHYVNADFKPLPNHIKEQLPELVVIEDLKRIVESVDLVSKNKGLEHSKFLIKQCKKYECWKIGDRITGKQTCTYDELKQAIADYEQLFGNTETLELETLRDCDTSPNCKKFDERVK